MIQVGLGGEGIRVSRAASTSAVSSFHAIILLGSQPWVKSWGLGAGSGCGVCVLSWAIAVGCLLKVAQRRRDSA